MAWNDQQPQPYSLSTTPSPSPPSVEEDADEQWFFQFHEHLLLTVQAIYRLRQALAGKML